MSKRELFNDMFEYKGGATFYEPYETLRTRPDQETDMDIFPVGTLTFTSHCHLRILQTDQETLIIATEVSTNPGTSITNATEIIATDVVRRWQLDLRKTRFIEHYTPESFEGADEEEYKEVRFTWIGQQADDPEWRKLSPQELVTLLESGEQRSQESLFDEPGKMEGEQQS